MAGVPDTKANPVVDGSQSAGENTTELKESSKQEDSQTEIEKNVAATGTESTAKKSTESNEHAAEKAVSLTRTKSTRAQKMASSDAVTLPSKAKTSSESAENPELGMLSKEILASSIKAESVEKSTENLVSGTLPQDAAPTASSSKRGVRKGSTAAASTSPKPSTADSAGTGEEPSSPVRKKRAFVPNYEPIQTRKRVKTPNESPPSAAGVAAGAGVKAKKDSTLPRTPRPRLSKDEVLAPDNGPRPKAVPKSLLILAPEQLPRKFKKKQAKLAAAPQIHATAEVDKDPSIAWPPPAGGKRAEPAVLMEVEEIRVEQGEDGTMSYILTSVPSTQPSGITATDAGTLTGVGVGVGVGSVSDLEEGQGVISAELSEGANKSDTPTSLLLLAEAAYPTTAAAKPQTAVAPTSTATRSPQTKSLLSGASFVQNKPGAAGAASAAAASPQVISVISRGGSPKSLTIVAPVTETAAGDAASEHWTCTVCGEMVTETDRPLHVQQHLEEDEEEGGEGVGEEGAGEEGEGDCVCDVCGEQCRDEEELELHVAVEHDEEEEEGEGGNHDDGDFDENEEETSEATRSILSTPVTASVSPALLTSASGTPIHTCDQCAETFPYAAYLRQHMKNAHSQAGAVFTCSHCQRTFPSKTTLENHSRLHQSPGGSISFKCIRCMQQFSSASLLSSHAQSCVQRDPVPGNKRGRGRGRGRGQGRGRSTDYVCSVCNRSFTSEVYLKAHQLSHSCTPHFPELYKSHPGPSGLQCLYCPEKFRHIGPLKEHILAQHPNAFPFKCSICQRGFARDNSRIAHERTHQTEKMFFCVECGEGFTLHAYLNRHMKYRHLKLTQFMCKVCHKTFVRHADLIKHNRVHTGEKPYVCELCGHGFGQQSNYKYHMMRHRGEKPHTCPMCNKGFRVPSHLKMHMQQHLNERFVCQICDKVYSQNRYLQRHMRTHNAGRQASSSERLVPVLLSHNNNSNNTTTTTTTTTAAISVDGQLVRTEQQIIVDSVGGDVSDQMEVQELEEGEVEPVIEFIINDTDADKGDDQQPGSKSDSGLEVESAGSVVVTTTSAHHPASSSYPNRLKVEIEGSGGSAEEQAYVNTDEGTSVVVGAFSEGEGGSMEEGSVTLPFKDLTQLIGGKHYNCDVCSQSFSIRPDSTYNMIHTGQSHILVISLNDHSHPEEAGS